MEQLSSSIEESGVRRSPRLAPRISDLPSTSSGVDVLLTPSERQSVGEVEIPIDSPVRPRRSVSVRRSLSSVNYPSLAGLERRIERPLTSEHLFAGWLKIPAIKIRAREIGHTVWKPILEVKGQKIVETWVHFDPNKIEWRTICVDGAVGRIDETGLAVMEANYESRRMEIDEVFMFLDEMVESIVFFLARRTIEEVCGMWGMVSNPLSDYLLANFKCAICGKIRKLRYLHARNILTYVAPDKRRCELLGRRYADPVTEKGYHLTSRALEQLVLETSTGHRDRREDQLDYGSLHTAEPDQDDLVGEQIPFGERNDSGGNMLSLLKSMGRQGMSVKPYEGKGGGITLKVWGDSLRRYFRLFNVRDGIDQVTLATCFLEGKAKDW